MQLNVPWDRVTAFVARKAYGEWSRLRAKHRNHLLSCSDVEIVLAYNAELRGFANYYALARDVKFKLNRLEYLQRWSMFKTLASKHKSSVRVVAARMRQGLEYLAGYEVGGQPRSVKVWKMTDLNRDRIDPDKVDVQPWTQIFSGSRTDWVDRQNATQCEACGRSDLPCHVHHVRGMADVAHRDQATRKAIARARKTKVLCVPCHKAIHGGPLPEQRT